MKKLIALIAALAVLAGLLTACAQEKPSETAPAQTQAAETLPALPQAGFAELRKLLGMEDSEAANFLGAGEENWTEDKSTFIGRIYQVSLLDHPVTVYTSYNNENKVASVSAWVTDGSRDVTQEEVDAWVQRVGDYAESEPIYDSTSSEAGSKNWKWKSDDVFITLHWLGDIVSIDLLPAVGELQ